MRRGTGQVLCVGWGDGLRRMSLPWNFRQAVREVKSDFNPMPSGANQTLGCHPQGAERPRHPGHPRAAAVSSKRLKQKQNRKTGSSIPNSSARPPPPHDFSSAVFHVVIYVPLSYIPSQIQHKLFKEGTGSVTFAHCTKLKTRYAELKRCGWSQRNCRLPEFTRQRGTGFRRRLTLHRARPTYAFYGINYKLLVSIMLETAGETL